MWPYYVAAFLVAIVAAYALAPKPQPAKPAGIEEVNAPTAEDGRSIPVVFGTRRVTGPNVVWYGDFKAVAIRKKGGK
jgi:hypothetical protein